MRPMPLYASLGLAVLLATPAIADDHRRAHVSVIGVGEAAIAPDMAEVTLTVTREAATAREALDANNEAMAAVLAAMKEEGIEARDMQSHGFSINPRMVFPRDGAEAEPRIVGYTVNNGLQLRIRNLDRLGAIIDRSVTLGVNQGGQINFTHSDPRETMDKARAEAVRDAMRRARILVEAAGSKLGDVLSIAEQGEHGSPMPKRFEMAVRSSADAVPIAAGENSYRVTVNVTFELDR